MEVPTPHDTPRPRALKGVWLILFGAMLGVGASLSLGVFASRTPGSLAGTPLAAPWLDTALRLVERDYVDPLERERLAEAAGRGLVGALDRHSALLDAREYRELLASTSGEYSGVGLEVVLDGGRIRVVAPLDGSPAAQAGLAPGDWLEAIDGHALPLGITLIEVLRQLRGAPGSRVRLDWRGGTDQRAHTATVAREPLRVQSVRSSLLEPGYGYLRLSHFTQRTPDEMRTALRALQAGSAGGLSGLVLDLRSNPGGLVEAGAAVADLFLDAGVIVTASGRAADSRFALRAQPGDLLGGARLVVLVNSGTASSAEILAAALRDQGRAVLVGRTTFGKGSVQTVLPLPEGRALKLTTARYLTPAGLSLADHGLPPDVELPRMAATPGRAPDADADVRAALVVLRTRQPAPYPRTAQ
jgi:carboxyl-terminal processing protease